MKRIHALALSGACLCLLWAFTALAPGLRTVHAPYQYPDPDQSRNMSSYTWKARCEIPEDLLPRLSTPALVETVLNYPRGTEILVNASSEVSAFLVLAQLNGVQELLRRPDGMALLQEAYGDMGLEDQVAGRAGIAATLLSGAAAVQELGCPLDQLLPP